MKHCGCLLNFPWKVKGSHKSKGRGGSIHQTARAGRYLEKHCNEVGYNFIEERTLKNNAKKIKYEED